MGNGGSFFIGMDEGVLTRTMDREYPGRRLSRAMAFRLAMLAWRVGSVNGEMESEEVKWAIEHLANEIKGMSNDEVMEEVLVFLRGYKWKRVSFVNGLGELSWLWNEYLARSKSNSREARVSGVNWEKKQGGKKRSWTWRLNLWR